MKRKILLLTVICLTLLSCIFNDLSPLAKADTVIEKSKLDTIDQYVQREMKTGKIPGLSLGIVYDNKVIYLQGYGYANPDKTPVTAETPFIIGSVTKTFTALAVRQLVNEGKLDYNAPVQKYIPYFTAADKEASKQITIENLINHSSGFSRASGDKAYTGYKYSLEELVRQLSNVKLSWAPGSHTEYSNLNYLVLGLVIQTVSGKTYETYIQENIFSVLDMKNSYLSEEAAKKNGMATGHRVVYGMDIPTNIPYPKGNAPYGFIISSAKDMSNYLLSYLNNGYYNGKSIIPSNELKFFEGITPSTPKNDEYYSAYWTLSQGDIGYYGHSGATVNFTSTMNLSQQSRYGIVILANAYNNFYEPVVNPDTISSGIISILEGHSMPPEVKVHIGKTYILVISIFTLSLLLLCLRAYWIKFFTKKIRKSKAGCAVKLCSLLLIDIILPLLILFKLPEAYNATMLYALSAQPELAYPLTLISIVLLLIGVVKIFKLISLIKSQKNSRFIN